MARAQGRPERKAYGLEQRYRAIKRKKEGVVVKPEVKTKETARRRGRPPGKKNEQPESPKRPTPISARQGRTFTEKEEAEVAALAAECLSQQVDVQAIRSKFEARYPNRKGLPMSVFYNALRRRGVYAALKRGDPPELAVAELPEDLVERAKVELELIRRRQRRESDEMEQHRQKYNKLLGREEVIRDFLTRMEKVEAFDESKPRLTLETAPVAPSAGRGPHECVHDAPDDPPF